VIEAYVTVVVVPPVNVIWIDVFIDTVAPIETLPLPPEQPVNVVAVVPVYVTVWTPKPDVTSMVPDVGNRAVEATVIVATGNETPVLTVVVAPVMNPNVEATFIVAVGSVTPLLATAMVVRAPLVSALVPIAIWSVPPVMAFCPNVMLVLLYALLKVLSPYHIPLVIVDGYGVLAVNSKLVSMTGVASNKVDQPLEPVAPVVSMQTCSLEVK
jgi:hypothetical protein